MPRLLKQKPSGHIYIYTDTLAQRKDMFPYEPEEQVQQEEPETVGDTANEVAQEDREGEEEAAPDQEDGTDQDGSEEEVNGETERYPGEKEALKEQYAEKFGRGIPPAIKLETLRAKVNGEE